MADFARGQLLVELREARHLSQEDAAHEIGVTAKSLRAWEKGGAIRWDNAKKVGDFYGVDPERLVSRELDGNGQVAELSALPLPGNDRLARIEEKLDQALNELSALRVALAVQAGSEGESKRPLSARTSRTTGKKRARS